MKAKYLEVTQNISLWLIIFACFSIALPTALMSISTVAFIIFWVISGDYKSKYTRVIHNPAALMALALFGFYIIGVFYSSAEWHERLMYLGKYQKLLFIPLIIGVMKTDKMREYALNAFLFSMIFVLLVSYFKWFGWVFHKDIGEGYFVFKGRIAHGIFMSFALYLMIYKALKTIGVLRVVWLTLSLLAVFNILVLVNGRTGQIIMLALIVWFTFEIWGLKSIKYWLGLLLVGFIIFQTLPDFLPHPRLLDTQKELAEHQPNGFQTASGQRMEMYKNTLSLIKQHPILGGGTGSIVNEYAQLAKSNNLSLYVTNPHSQFLLTIQELGIAGLMVLVLMWKVTWKNSYHLSSTENGVFLRGLILTMVIGSIFNSLLLDAGEGKFYCLLAGVFLSAYKPIRREGTDA